MVRISRLLGASVLGLTAACGGGGTGPGGGGGGGGGGSCPANTICMTAGAFSPTSRTVNTNTAVTWDNNSTTGHNVNFTDPASALGVGGAGGNFDAPASTTNQRQFAAAGTYAFHCSIHGSSNSGMRGTVVVQ